MHVSSSRACWATWELCQTYTYRVTNLVRPQDAWEYGDATGNPQCTRCIIQGTVAPGAALSIVRFTSEVLTLHAKSAGTRCIRLVHDSRVQSERHAWGMGHGIGVKRQNHGRGASDSARWALRGDTVRSVGEPETNLRVRSPCINSCQA
jgi:hypothetical protein